MHISLNAKLFLKFMVCGTVPSLSHSSSWHAYLSALVPLLLLL